MEPTTTLMLASAGANILGGIFGRRSKSKQRAAEKEINQIDHKPSSLIFESLIETMGVKN